MHDQHVESLAKKLRKASVDPKKLKEKGKEKGKAEKNTNANAIGKKGGDLSESGGILVSYQKRFSLYDLPTGWDEGIL